MKKCLILLFLITILTCGCDSSLSSGKITCDNMKMIMQDDNSILLDVRTIEEYNDGHLEGSINIPYNEIETRIKEISSINKDTKIIVYCKSGNRSSKAFDILKKLGYLNIYDLGSINNCL